MLLERMHRGRWNPDTPHGRPGIKQIPGFEAEGPSNSHVVQLSHFTGEGSDVAQRGEATCLRSHSSSWQT